MDGLKLSFPLANKSANSELFLKEVEILVEKHNITYLEAAILYCEKNDIEIEIAASLITSNAKFKSALQNDGEALNFLPRTAKLPI